MKIKFTGNRVCLFLILLLSAALNIINLGIEGYANQYYAAAVKSMTISWKNFFFVALDPAGFVTVDKPPFGFWIQALSAKLFGFSSWSILLPQAIAGILSVILLYTIVKRSFGTNAGLLSALCLAVTPVFVAVSRNNTVDNQLVFFLLLACWAISVAAEKGKFKFVALCMVLIGIGFNVKMLQAYMILPAIYILYLFSNGASITKRIIHIAGGTAILIAVSLSWALIVDAVPTTDRPYIGSSKNNTVMGLITGHNGSERLNFSSILGGSNESVERRDGGPGVVPGSGFNGGAAPDGTQGMRDNRNDEQRISDNQNNAIPEGQLPSYNRPQPNGNRSSQINTMPGGSIYQRIEENTPKGDYSAAPDRSNMQPPQGGFGDEGFPPGGGPGGNPGAGSLSGTFGSQTKAGIFRLFEKNVLSDQIVWFIPLTVIGFIAAAIKEKLRFRLDNRRKQGLVLWFMWFLPEFVYFSFNTGLFHSYYLTMMAPPIAALAGIGITYMWNMYKEGGWRSWFLPAALLANGGVELLMLTYFKSTTRYINALIAFILVLSFIPTLILVVLNFIKLKTIETDEKNITTINRINNLKKVLVSLTIAGIVIIPLAGASAAMFFSVNSTMPGAGLELLPKVQSSNTRHITENSNRDGNIQGQKNSYGELEAFLNNNKVNGKSQLVVGSANISESITLNTNIYVGSLGGFQGNEKVMTLDQFKKKVSDGEIRFVLANSTDGRGGSSNNEIMNWVKENGKLISYGTEKSGTENQNQLYDLLKASK